MTDRLSRGDWIRCERNLEKYPSCGTWPRYNGRLGRIVTINFSDKEFGVKFTASSNESTTWFKEHELTAIPQPSGTPNIRVQDLTKEDQ